MKFGSWQEIIYEYITEIFFSFIGILGAKLFFVDPKKCYFMLISEKTTRSIFFLRQEKRIQEDTGQNI